MNKVKWTIEHEQAVCQYINSTDNIERNKIFTKFLYPQFQHFVNAYVKKIYKTANYPEDIHNDAMSYILEQLDKYNPEYGSRAYSYFSVITKNFILGEIRKKKRGKIDFFEYLHDNVIDDMEDSLNEMKHRDNLVLQIRNIITNLPYIEQLIFNAYINGAKNKDQAMDLKISTSEISKIIKKIKLNIKSQITDEEDY